MKKIYNEDLEYYELFKYQELKYSFYFYKNYYKLFDFKFNQFDTYYYYGNPSVEYIFIGGFLRINEYHLDDITPIYIFLEHDLLSEKYQKKQILTIFFNDMLLLNKKFQKLESNQIRIDSIKNLSLNYDKLIRKEKLKEIITYSINHESELLQE